MKEGGLSAIGFRNPSGRNPTNPLSWPPSNPVRQPCPCLNTQETASSRESTVYRMILSSLSTLIEGASTGHIYSAFVRRTTIFLSGLVHQNTKKKASEQVRNIYVRILPFPHPDF